MGVQSTRPPESSQLFADGGEDVRQRIQGGQGFLDLAARCHYRVRMAIGEARQDHPRVGINDPRLRPRRLEDRLVLPQRDDSTILDGNRLGQAELVIDGHDLGVMHDQVGRPLGLQAIHGASFPAVAG